MQINQEVYVKSKVSRSGIERGTIVAIYPESNSFEIWYEDGTYDEKRFEDIV
ncbi:hypothetical protein ACQGRJ_09485 [Bacillus atrophaeus]|uniref:hypothetical protein n=1 Tax=Bacillus atrophaeus TaxID=1452 RepID=UPI002281A938|nr:hypothetical protein [Bacillus atrophaeus]MCY8932671.1 hypothetical protein [Bacillus atrophaeus]